MKSVGSSAILGALLLSPLAEPLPAATFSDAWRSALDVFVRQDATTNGNRVTSGGDTLWTIDPGADDHTQETSEGSSKSSRARVNGNSFALAVAYGDLGFNFGDNLFDHMIYEADKGLTDPGTYFWNDG